MVTHLINLYPPYLWCSNQYFQPFLLVRWVVRFTTMYSNSILNLDTWHCFAFHLNWRTYDQVFPLLYMRDITLSILSSNNILQPSFQFLLFPSLFPVFFSFPNFIFHFNLSQFFLSSINSLLVLLPSAFSWFIIDPKLWEVRRDGWIWLRWYCHLFI